MLFHPRTTSLCSRTSFLSLTPTTSLAPVAQALKIKVAKIKKNADIRAKAAAAEAVDAD